LRDRASELERFYIESHYYQNVTGDQQQAIQVYELWAQTYPRDSIPPGNLSVCYTDLGQWEKALPAALEGYRLSPDESLTYFQVGWAYLGLGRLDEAKATANQALARKLDVPYVHVLLYMVAFSQNDPSAMSHELSVLSSDSPENAARSLSLAASSESYFGHLEKARALNQRAIGAFEGAGKKEQAATTIAAQARVVAAVDDAAAARRDAAAALALESSLRIKSGAAYVFARAGDAARAESLVGELAKERPSDTYANAFQIPTIRAAIELNRNNPGKAIEILQPVQAYDLARVTALLSAYERGQAYLLLHRGNEAAAEFQKLLDHPGIVLNSILGALAHLQLGRAYALQGDTAKARTAYQDFFALWKDADPDIPILKQAKAEYAKLK
jgi:tetratricopeptide (TPR) repeat protein